MKRSAVMAALVVALALAARAAPPEQLAWIGGLEAAQQDARTRKVPLLVVLNMDGEPGNERMLAEVYTDPKVRDAAKRCAVTIASMYPHAQVDDPPSGRKVCSRFGRVTCAEHKATEEVVRKEWLKKGPKDDVDSPRHIVWAPDGRVLFESVWTLDPAELVALIDRAVAACTPESLAAWDTPAARLARCSDALGCLRRQALADATAARDAALDEKLFEMLRKCESEGVARDAVHALASDPTPSRAEGIKKLLSAPTACVRLEAAAAIARQKAKDAFDLLSAAMAKEKSAEVKAVLLRALAVSGGDPAKTREIVLKAAKSGEGPVRVHAIVALAPWASEDAVVEALRKLPTNDKLAETLRAAACWTLGLSGRKEVADELRAAGEGKSEFLPRVARAAAARLAAGAPDPNYLYFRSWIAPLSVELPDNGVR